MSTETRKRQPTAKKLQPNHSLPSKPRRGRPPREMAGEVEDRIVEAALKVFIARGYEGASIDEIAEVARAGKPSIYARFTNKETLFRDVVLRWSQKSTANLLVCSGGDIEKRFQSMALTIVRNVIKEETVGLMRSVIAEVTRHPELATTIHYALREHTVKLVTSLILDMVDAEETRDLTAFAPDNLAATARRFIDTVLLPQMVSALFHADLTPVREQMEDNVRKTASFFLRGCGFEPKAPVQTSADGKANG